MKKLICVGIGALAVVGAAALAIVIPAVKNIKTEKVICDTEPPVSEE